MMFRNPLHAQRFGLVWFSLFLMAAAFAQTAMSQDEGFCYQIHLDGKDRSAFQYVSRNFLVFSDPSWTTNPAVKTVRWVETKAGKSLVPVPVLRPTSVQEQRILGAASSCLIFRSAKN